MWTDLKCIRLKDQRLPTAMGKRDFSNRVVELSGYLKCGGRYKIKYLSKLTGLDTKERILLGAQKCFNNPIKQTKIKIR